jgi:hypothetical protein
MIAFDRLSKIIPPGQALAWKAIQVSFQQIKNVSQLTLPNLSASFIVTETTRDLPQIEALKQAVPASVQSFYQTSYATGSGPNGTLTLADVIGLCAGIGFTTPLTNAVVTINSLQSTGALTNLNTVYTRMQNTINGDYGDPVTGPVTIPSGPGAGSYTDGNDAFSTGLIPAANSAIGTVATSYPSQVAVLNSSFTTIANNYAKQTTNITSASIDVANLVGNSTSVVMGFIPSLHNYGNDTREGGPAQILEAVANKATLGGQAIVASLREGRNLTVLSTTGVGQDTNVPSTPKALPPPAVLIPSTYSATAAANLVVKN